MLNDPITGQGSNNASKMATAYLPRDRGARRRAVRPRPSWSRRSRASGRATGQFATTWTNALLSPPPEHVLKLLTAGNESPQLAHRFANGFDDPRRLLRVVHVPGQGGRVSRRGGRGRVARIRPPDRDRRGRAVRAAARARSARRRPRGDARLGPQRGRGRLRPGPVEPVHVRDVARDGARARPRLLGGRNARRSRASRWRCRRRTGAARRSTGRRGSTGRPSPSTSGSSSPAGSRSWRSAAATFVVHEAGVDDLERYARDHESWLVATGKGSLPPPFPARLGEVAVRDAAARARADVRERASSPRPGHSAVCFNIVPGVGEYFVFPALTTSGPCEIMVFEGIPGGPDGLLGRRQDAGTAPRAVARDPRACSCRGRHARCADVELTDTNGILTGRFAPTVRRPVAHLPSGAPVLGMADAVGSTTRSPARARTTRRNGGDLPRADPLSRRRAVRRALDAADVRPLLARLRPVGRLLDERAACAAAAARRAPARRGAGAAVARGARS